MTVIALRLTTCVCLLACFTTASAQEPSDTKAVPGVKRAVMVGCTTYDKNPSKSLKGGGNDVGLMAETLKRHFHFDEANLVRLIEGHGQALRPTRKNIVGAIEKLIAESNPHDYALIYLAGHGSQQPDMNHTDDDPEPDGMDELFLPADIGVWTSETRGVENAIIDDEIRDWINRLLKKNVTVVLIVDACHSGSSARGDLGSDTPREIIPSELKVPEGVGSALSTRGETPRAEQSPIESPMDRLATGNWVALYAAQSYEQAWERDVPETATLKGDKSAKQVRRGVFTHQLCSAIEQSNRNPSYAQLIQQIRGNLIAEGWRLATPGIEGTIPDRLLFDERHDRQRSYILEQAGKKWRIDGGSLHGLTAGSQLAVYDPSDSGHKAQRAVIEVVQAGIASSQVEPAPDSAGKTARFEDLRSGDICVPILLNLDQARLKIGIDPLLPDDDAKTIQHRLDALTRSPSSTLRSVECSDAQWIISPYDTNHWFLQPRAEALVVARGNDPQDIGAGLKLSRIEDEFATQLTRAARTQSLLRLAQQMSWSDNSSLASDITLDVLRTPRDTPNATPQTLDRSHAEPLQEGDRLSFRVLNGSKEAADVTLLFIDSELHIHALFPRTFAADNRIPAGKDFTTAASRVTADTTGREQILLIAVKANARARIPASFAFLAEADGDRASRSLERSRGDDPPTRRFDSLLMSLGFARDGSRGLDLGAEEGILMTRDWIVAAPKK